MGKSKMSNENAKNEFLVNLYAPALAWIKAITDAEDGTIDEVREVMEIVTNEMDKPETERNCRVVDQALLKESLYCEG